MTALGHPAGMPHQAFGLLITVDTDQQTAAHCRCLLALLTVALTKVGIDPRRRGLHRQLA